MTTILGLAAFAALSFYAVNQFRNVNRSMEPRRNLRLMEEANRDRNHDWERHRG